MNYLLDTNVISEWVKPHPDVGVVDWLLNADEDRVFLSVISLAEIRRGIELLTQSKHRTRLFDWLINDLTQRFEGRIIDVHQVVAQQWGICMAQAQSGGITISSMDGFIAATAQVHELTLVTRNMRDFQNMTIALLNPWERG